MTLRRLGYEPWHVTDVATLPADGPRPIATILDLLSTPDPRATVAALRAYLGQAPAILALTDLFRTEPGHARWASEVAVFLPRPVGAEELEAAIVGLLAPPGERPPPSPTRPTVLLADDDPINLRLSRRILENQGYAVHTAANGREALELAEQLRPDALVSDILMPNMNGFELCVEIRNHPALATLPVILVSANFVEEGDRLLAERACATSFLVRTSTLSEVIAALESALAGAARPVGVPRREVVEAELGVRLRRQLEVQAALNMRLARRTSLTETELAVLTGLADSVGVEHDIRRALGQVLANVVEQGGLSFALLYLVDELGTPTLTALTGDYFEGNRKLPPDGALLPLVARALATQHCIAIPEGDGDGDGDGAPTSGADLLRGPRVSSMLLVPLKVHTLLDGVLLLGADRHDLSEEPRRRFARIVGMHVAQAVGLHRATLRHAPPEDPDRAVHRAIARIAAELTALGTLAAALAPAADPAADPSAAALREALRRPEPTVIDLAEWFGAPRPTVAGSCRVVGCPAALDAALTILGVTGPEAPRPVLLQAEGGITIQAGPVTPGATPAAHALATETIRRHGGEASGRPWSHDRVGMRIRLPRAPGPLRTVGAPPVDT